MADVIYVTAQVLDKRLRTLEQGVNNIVPFTRRLPQIAAKADEALTIAQRLSGQMAKLGPLFRIVGIVANILAIVEQIAIIKTFADRIEAVDNQLDAHDAQLTKMNSLLLSARKRLSESEAKVKNLNNIAAEARSNAKKALTNLNTIQAKVTALNHDVAQLKTHSKESIGRLDLIEPKLKSLNDDLYEARVHANDALNRLDNRVEPKLQSLNDDTYEAKTRANKAIDRLDNMVDPKLKSLNDDTYQAKTQAGQALKRLDTIDPKLKSLNDDTYQAKTQASQAVKRLDSLEPTMRNITSDVVKLNAGASATTVRITALEGKVITIDSNVAQARVKADQALLQKATPGPAGPQGLPGSPGIAGKTGPAGRSGVDGKDGKQGIQGIQGLQGIPGLQGVPGKAGANGRDGINGLDGKPGKDGKDVDQADVNDIKSKLAQITSTMLPIALFTVAVNGINQNVNRSINQLPSSEAFKAGVAAGNCRTTQPGGCMSKKFDESNGKIDRNGQGIDRVNAALNAADLGLLGVVNDKLGDKIPNGGIGGLLQKSSKLVSKTWNFLQMDRVLAVLTFTTSLHNAYMLSSSLTQTLFSAIANILDVFGLEDAEGSPLNVGEMVGKWTEGFFIKAFGAETTAGIKQGWAQLNRIYQAASNVMWSVQSIFDSMRSLTEVAIENTGKIGNALRKAGAVFENAYGNLTEKATARNLFQRKLDNFSQGISGVEDVISNIDSAASEVLSIQETVKELKDQQKEFKDSVEAFKKDADTKELTAKAASVAPQL